MPPDSIVDGAIMDGGVVANVIRQVFEKNGIKAKGVVASLSGNAVIVKKVTLPLMNEEELAESIFWEAEQYIPFDIQDVNLDYQVLEAGTNDLNRGSMDVLLVAAKREKVADYTGVISQAGRVPVLVDVDAFALQNAFEINYGVDMSRVTVLINAGASAININIIAGGQSLVHARHLAWWQRLYRGAPKGAEPDVPRRRPLEARTPGRGCRGGGRGADHRVGDRESAPGN